jgi:uncharacterized protein (DUF1499 family)
MARNYCVECDQCKKHEFMPMNFGGGPLGKPEGVFRLPLGWFEVAVTEKNWDYQRCEHNSWITEFADLCSVECVVEWNKINNG